MSVDSNGYPWKDSEWSGSMTPTDAEVEAVARALLDHTPTWTGEHWDEDRRYTVREFLDGTHLSSIIETIALDAARAAIAALDQVRGK